MIDNLCPRCDSKFYTSYPETDTRCPFCGFVLKSDKDELRSVKRAFIQKDCLLISGEEVGAGRTVDLSERGVGVEVVGSMPFNRDDRLHIVIKDFEIDINAKVMWVKGLGGRTTRAGLMFVGAVS